LTTFGEYVYFRADDGTTGYELWRTNGTTTARVADINPSGADSSNPSGFTPFGDWLYFTAVDSTFGFELWRTNGNSTARVADINQGVEDSAPRGFTALGDYLYFAADDGTGVPKFWRVSSQGLIESAVLSGTNSFIGCLCENPIIALDGRLFSILSTSETGSEFAYLDEPTFVLPETNRDGSVWSTALVLLAAVTAAAGLTVRMPEAKRR
jgi:ELWxxDGT repeat protein